MLDYTNVSREVRSLVSRRRELLTFLGSVFAALGIFLQNVLQGTLPPVYHRMQQHAFAYYALLLLVPSVILSLRLARLNAGLTLNGILYQRLMQEQDFTRKGSAATMRRAARLNVFGVGFLMSLLADLLAGLAAALLVLALAREPWEAAAAGGAVVAVSLLLYLLFHYGAARLAWHKAATEPCTPFNREQWEEHVAGSRDDGNRDMIAILALAGLIVFSAFEGLSGLGRHTEGLDLTSKQVDQFGPVVYGLLMAVTCLLSLVTYIRLRLAIGHRSLELDPTDRPFRPLKLTDSLLGYLLLAFLLVVSLHFLLYNVLRDQHELLLLIDTAVFAGALALEQITIVIAGWRVGKV
ncbi:MAG TPA: hypothetical protein VJ739_06620 [Gemmataceae bacterium]|nr:hypothetical protein [Gemmataceae bacterium]